MNLFQERSLMVALALLLEAVLKEPADRWHPVAWLGGLIDKVEKLLRRGSPARYIAILSGGLGWLLVLIFALASGVFLLYIGIASRWWYRGFSVLFVWLAISPKSLGVTARQVAASLDDPERARGELSRMVGRATIGLDEERVCAAAVESVAENTVDALVAPILYAILLGPLGALGYRVINTLDSMWGYRNESYENFGKVAARADDIANFIPARVTVLLVGIATFLRTGRWRGILAAAVRYGGYHPSINSGLPEAAMAAALNIKLGGPVTYGPRLHERPFICPAGKRAGSEDVDAAVDILNGVWLVLLATTAFGGFIGLLT